MMPFPFTLGENNRLHNLVEILAESDDYLVVNKPIGIAVQGTQDSLLSQLKAERKSDNLYPVHRLDQVTSGCVILARNSVANRILSMAFQERKAEKYYLAVSDKKPTKKQGHIVGDMVKGRVGSYKLLRSRDNPAKSSFFSYSLGKGQRLYVLRLYTGKTHQARVALKSIGAAILGDERYGGSAADRVYLHAYRLRISTLTEQLDFTCRPMTGVHFLNPEVQSILTDIGPVESLPWVY